MKNFKLKSSLQNLSLFFISIILFASLSEIVLRFFGYGDLIIYQPDPKLFWKPKPGQNCFTKIGHKPIHVNSKGTRGKDFDENKPENVLRIISLGDSKTFGWGLSESETYSELLKDLIEKHFSDGLHIEVINAGVNAWSYAQMNVYLRDIGMKYNPDVVILADANLWTQFSEHGSREFIEKFMRRVWLKNLLRRSASYHFFIEVKLQKVYNKYRKKFIPVDPGNDKLFKDQQKSNPYLFIEEEIAEFCQLVKEHNVKALIISIPHENEILLKTGSKIVSIKKEICDIFDIPLIDFTEDFSRSSKKLFLEGDAVHPNVEGNQIIANRIFNFVIEEIGK